MEEETAGGRERERERQRDRDREECVCVEEIGGWVNEP